MGFEELLGQEGHKLVGSEQRAGVRSSKMLEPSLVWLTRPPSQLTWFGLIEELLTEGSTSPPTQARGIRCRSAASCRVLDLYYWGWRPLVGVYVHGNTGAMRCRGKHF